MERDLLQGCDKTSVKGFKLEEKVGLGSIWN